MKVFGVLFLVYVIIGGCLCGALDKQFVESCHKHLTNEDATLVYVFWPQLILTTLITDNTGEDICAK